MNKDVLTKTLALTNPVSIAFSCGVFLGVWTYNTIKSVKNSGDILLDIVNEGY